MAALELHRGDITNQPDVDAIVNAANRELAPGAGVCGAIYRVGGASIFEEAARLGGCDTGDARATSAGDLPNRFVIHAVGPVYHGRPEDGVLLASCHRRAVEEAAELGCASIAFPAISTGAYGYPVAEASVIAVGAVHGWVLNHPGMLDRVTFVLRDADTLEAYQSAHQRRKPLP